MAMYNVFAKYDLRHWDEWTLWKTVEAESEAEAISMAKRENADEYLLGIAPPIGPRGLRATPA